MLTVRFDTGFSVQYNSANYVIRHEKYTDLYTTKDGAWVAQAPNTAIIESTPPCRCYRASDGTADGAEAFLQMVEDRSRDLPRRVLARVKKLLARYDARTMSWH